MSSRDCDTLAPWHHVALGKLPLLEGRSLLEVGCGRGDFAIELALRKARVSCCDFSEAAIEIAKERAAASGVTIDAIACDAEQLAFPDNAFDYTLSCEVLEHVPNPKKMLAELYRVTRPGGRCLVTTESYLNGMLLAWAKSYITGKPFNSGSGVQPRENFFLYFLVQKWMKSVGFRLISSESWHFQFLLLPRVNPEKLCIERFQSPSMNSLFKPFGRHFCFELEKPAKATTP